MISDSITVKGIALHKEGRDRPYKDLHLTCTIDSIEYSSYTNEKGEYSFTVPANSGEGTIKIVAWRRNNVKECTLNTENTGLTLKKKKSKYIRHFVGSF
jgi:hypothetical protein